MLIENSNKDTGTWKTAKKKTGTLNRKINSTNYETITNKNRFSALATSNNELIEATEDKEINYNVMTDNNPQKNQPKVKRRPNIAITGNYIRSQNIKTVPCDRMYASPT